MNSVTQSSDVVRKEAEWMKPKDDRILEALREHGNLTPQALDDLGITVPEYAGERLKELSKYGLVERFSRGLYRITSEGESYLDEELDASELSPVDDE